MTSNSGKPVRSVLLLRSLAFCGAAVGIAACCHVNPPPPPPPHPFKGPPINCVNLQMDTFIGQTANGTVSLNVPQPPPETPGIKHNVQIGNTPYAGWCLTAASISMNITPANGAAGDPPIAVWLLTQGNGNDIHVKDDGSHSGTTPTPGLDDDLVPQ